MLQSRPRLAIVSVGMGAFLLLALIFSSAIAIKRARARREAIEQASRYADLTRNLMTSSNLALRKKLELPFQLNFSSVDLPRLLNWIEKQLDIDFQILVDPNSLKNVPVKASNRPLIEVLSEVLSKRNMALVLQRDSVLIVPCTQNIEPAILGKQNAIAFRMQTELGCEVEEPVEIYGGDRGQYRIHLLAHVGAEKGPQQLKRSLLVSLYVDRQLKAYTEIPANDDRPAEVPFANLPGVSLRLKPIWGKESALVLSMSFVYTEVSV